MTQSLRWTAILCSILLAGCGKKKSDADDDMPIRPSARDIAPSASASSATPASSAPVPTYASRAIDDGKASDGHTWIPKFSIRRNDGDQGVNVLKAYGACADNGMALCTDNQWVRACGVDPALGAIETWTVSFAGSEGFVVRGGQGGCSARKVVRGSEFSPTRAGVCCDRGVSISTDNQNKSFLLTVSDKMTRYEKGIRKKSGASLAPFIDDNIVFFGKSMSHDELVSKYDGWFRQNPDQWTVYDTCEVTIQPGEDATWTADCSTTAQKGGEVAFVTTRYLWSGRGKVQRIEETKVHRKFSPP